MVIDGTGVAFKEFPECGAVVTARSEPQFFVRYVIVFTPHEHIMGRTVASVPLVVGVDGALQPDESFRNARCSGDKPKSCGSLGIEGLHGHLR
jgi:hypothetical protein